MAASVWAQRVWHEQAARASPGLLSGNSRREFSSTDAAPRLSEGDPSPDFYWLCDPASFGFASGASHDPIGSSPNLYEYCGDRPLTNSDPTGLMSPSEASGLIKWGGGLDYVAPPPAPPWDASIGLQGVKDQITRVLATKQKNGCQPVHLGSNSIPSGQAGHNDFNGNPNAFWSDDLGDLIANINGKCRATPKKCQCVGVLELFGHGNPDGMGIGSSATSSGPAGINHLDENTVVTVGVALAGSVKFCKPCMIIANGCNTGNANSGWLDKLAKLTGCAVVGLGGFGQGTFLGGNVNPTTVGVDHWELSGIDSNLVHYKSYYKWHPEKTTCACDSEHNTYHVFEAN
jgi:hypothetical protein